MRPDEVHVNVLTAFVDGASASPADVQAASEAWLRNGLARALAAYEAIRSPAEARHLAEQVQALKDLTHDTDGNLLPPEAELPVGVFYGVLYGTEHGRRPPSDKETAR